MYIDHNHWNDVLRWKTKLCNTSNVFLMQGVWKIQVDGESHERVVQYFEVCELVLPKFEVSINAPPFITYNQEENKSVQKIHISVCAKYHSFIVLDSSFYTRRIIVYTRRRFNYFAFLMTVMQIHRYSYGQPVRGSMKTSIKVKSSVRYYHRRYSL